VRRLVLEAAVTGVVSILVACAALGLLPGDGTWFSRSAELMVSAATLEFTSTLAREPVLVATVRASGRSVAIIGTTAFLLLLIGVPLGIASVVQPQSTLLRSLRRLIDTLSCVPVLIWATLIFALLVRNTGIELSADVNPVRATVAAILALLMGDRILADLVQRVELRTREVLAEPWMRTVRAGRLGVRRHLLQSLVPAVAESIASRAMFLLGGAIVAERVFAIDGLGYLVISALERSEREPELILALSLMMVLIGLAFRLITGAATRLADPRVAR
jgi:ABC-type dipeptide/oligopeptide/nickel transport system permease component